MKPVISLRDVEEMVRNGQDLASVPADALLTPSARDFLRDRENQAATPLATPSSAKPSAPAKLVNSKSSKAEIEAFFNTPQINEFKKQLCDIGRRLWERAYV